MGVILLSIKAVSGNGEEQCRSGTWIDQHTAPIVPRTLAAIGTSIWDLQESECNINDTARICNGCAALQIATGELCFKICGEVG